MKALFFGVVTLFLIVGMSNDAQAACNAGCQAKCRAMQQHSGLTYEQCLAKRSKLNEKPAEARRTIARERNPFPGWTFCPGGTRFCRSGEGPGHCCVDWSGR